MDNRVFNVNGEGREMLLRTLELVFEQKRIGCAGWVQTERGLVLLWHVDPAKGETPFPSKRLAAHEVLPLVLSWLDSDEAKSLVLSDWDADVDHDGSNSRGWRVYVEDWGHVGGNSHSICCVTPAFMWHGK